MSYWSFVNRKKYFNFLPKKIDIILMALKIPTWCNHCYSLVYWNWKSLFFSIFLMLNPPKILLFPQSCVVFKAWLLILNSESWQHIEPGNWATKVDLNTLDIHLRWLYLHSTLLLRYFVKTVPVLEYKMADNTVFFPR